MARAAKQTTDDLSTRGTEQVIEREHLEKALASGKKLRVKLGIDPTAPDLHLGHAVVLRKLRAFQDAGHKAVLIIGDFTARIGDPSGKSKLRPPLKESEIEKNAKTYLAQAGKVIDVKKTEIRRNSEWLEKRGLAGLLEIARGVTVDQVLERDDFKKRRAAGEGISILEELYPILQGYDSVAVKADVELGGTDQLFNLLMGRRVQRHFGMKEQDVLTVPLLVGLDGVQKMSKSLGNYIGVTESPDEMFGKTMTIPDELMPQYFALCTNIRDISVEKSIHASPRQAKARLAREIVKTYHGEAKARTAEEKWEKQFSRKEMPAEISEFKTSQTRDVVYLLVKSGISHSKSDAWRLVRQGAVKVSGKDVTNPKHILSDGDIIRIGKRHIFRIKIK